MITHFSDRLSDLQTPDVKKAKSYTYEPFILMLIFTCCFNTFVGDLS